MDKIIDDLSTAISGLLKIYARNRDDKALELAQETFRYGHALLKKQSPAAKLAEPCK